ncbi:hypothetical protein YC2023_084418 [Brassica napus]
MSVRIPLFSCSAYVLLGFESPKMLGFCRLDQSPLLDLVVEASKEWVSMLIEVSVPRRTVGLELPNDMLMELMSYEARGRLFRCRTGTGNVSGTGSSRRHHCKINLSQNTYSRSRRNKLWLGSLVPTKALPSFSLEID